MEKRPEAKVSKIESSAEMVIKPENLRNWLDIVGNNN